MLSVSSWVFVAAISPANSAREQEASPPLSRRIVVVYCWTVVHAHRSHNKAIEAHCRIASDHTRLVAVDTWVVDLTTDNKDV